MNGEDELRIVLLGKTGAGKSSIGNTILGEKEFTAKCSVNSVTQICERVEKEINGRRIVVIDTPGIFDTNRSEEEVKEEVISSLVESAPGPHVFILVLVETHTQENQKALEKLLEYFSDNIFPHLIILFTHGEDLDENMEILQFITPDQKEKSGKHSLKDVTEKCGDRVHVIDNKYWNQNSRDLDVLERLKQLNLPEEAIRDITKQMQLPSTEETPWFNVLSEQSNNVEAECQNETKEQHGKEYRSNKFQLTQLMKSVKNILVESKGKHYSNDALEAVGEAINVEEENSLQERGLDRETADMAEIRREAKERVRDKLGKKLASVAVGVLLGALLGVGVGLALPVVAAVSAIRVVWRGINQVCAKARGGAPTNEGCSNFGKASLGTVLSVPGAITMGIAAGMGAIGAGAGVIVGAVLGGVSGVEVSKKAYSSKQAVKTVSQTLIQNAGDVLKECWNAGDTGHEYEPLNKDD